MKAKAPPRQTTYSKVRQGIACERVGADPSKTRAHDQSDRVKGPVAPRIIHKYKGDERSRGFFGGHGKFRNTRFFALYIKYIDRKAPHNAPIHSYMSVTIHKISAKTTFGREAHPGLDVARDEVAGPHHHAVSSGDAPRLVMRREGEFETGEVARESSLESAMESEAQAFVGVARGVSSRVFGSPALTHRTV